MSYESRCGRSVDVILCHSQSQVRFGGGRGGGRAYQKHVTKQGKQLVKSTGPHTHQQLKPCLQLSIALTSPVEETCSTHIEESFSDLSNSSSRDHIRHAQSMPIPVTTLNQPYLFQFSKLKSGYLGLGLSLGVDWNHGYGTSGCWPALAFKLVPESLTKPGPVGTCWLQ